MVGGGCREGTMLEVGGLVLREEHGRGKIGIYFSSSTNKIIQFQFEYNY